jgi:chromosome segregation ATPase
MDFHSPTGDVSCLPPFSEAQIRAIFVLPITFPMADIKFPCPECQQRILVDDSAAGVAIDCPSCNAGLIIPAKATDVVQVVRRPSANAGGAVAAGGEELSAELRKKQQDLDAALAETTSLRADLQAAARERDSFRASGEQSASELKRMRTEENRVKSELEQTRTNLNRTRDDAKKLAEDLELANQRAAGIEDLESLKSRLAVLERERDEARIQAKISADEVKVATARLRIDTGASREHPSAKFQQLLAERDDLLARLTLVQLSVNTATAERDELKVSNNAARAEIAALRRDVEVAVRKLELEQRKMKDLGESFATSERERIELAKRVSQNPEAKELAVQREKVAILQAQLSDAQVSTQTFRGERERVRTLLAEREEALKVATQAAEAARAEAGQSKQELTEAQAKASDLQQRLDALTENLAGRERELAEARETLVGAVGGRDDLAAKLSALESGTAERAASLEKAQAEAKDLQQRVDALSESLRTSEGALKETRDAFASIVIDRDESVVKLAALESAMAERAASLEKSQEEAKALQQRLDGVLADLATRDRELTEARATLVAATGSRSEAQEKLAVLESAVAERAALLEKTQAELATATELARVQREGADASGSALAAAQADLKKASDTAAELQEALATQKARSEGFLRRIESVEAELAHRTGDLGGARHDLSQAIDRERKLREEFRAREVEWDARASKLDIALAAASSKAEQERLRADGAGEKMKHADTELASAKDQCRLLEAECERLKQELDRAATASPASGTDGSLQDRTGGDDNGTLAVRGFDRRVEETLEKLRMAEKERDTARSEIEGQRQGLERAKQHIAVLQSRRDQMRDEIARLKVKLGLAPDAVV